MHSSIVFSVVQAAALLATPISAHLINRSPAASSQTVSVGAHVLYSYEGAGVPTELHELVDQGKVGGVILFGNNVNSDTPKAMEALQATWASSHSYNGAPLLIVTDQEGGQLRRLPGGPTQSEKEIGVSSNPSSAAAEAGKQAASTLLQYHNNGNLAPVCGVYREPGDFLDSAQRSYSDKSKVASECVSAFVKAQQAAGAVAAAKHFPGLGAAGTNEDTDNVPVTLSQSFQDLLTIDMPPFEAAVKAGVKMIMPSWAYYPALDKDYPSGLSSKWLQQELRGRLGFKGVTISDAIQAGGLIHFGDNDGYRATLATKAGMDIILAAVQNPSQGSGIVATLSTALSNGTLDKTAFEESTQRILALRKDLHK